MRPLLHLSAGCVFSLMFGFGLGSSLSPRPSGADEPTHRSVVRAGSFQLTDAEGRVRAELTVLEDGAPRFRLLDKMGRDRARVGLSPDDQPSISLYDQDGYETGGFQTDKDTTALHLSSIERRGLRHSINLSAHRNGTLALDMSDYLGTHAVGHVRRAELKTGSENPYLVLSGGERGGYALISSGNSEAAAVRLFFREEKPYWTTPRPRRQKRGD